MRRFRGKNVIGWKTVIANSKDKFDEKVNKLMDEYDFEDYQYSTTSYRAKEYLPSKIYHSASILLRMKE